MIWWQEILLHTNPVAVSLGGFSVRYYALAWIAVMMLLWAYVLFRIPAQKREMYESAVLTACIGAILGGRIGYAVLYAPATLLTSPWQLVWPFDAQGAYTGISGMSFHGGVIGVTIAVYSVARRYRVSPLEITDTLVRVFPWVYVLGRLGNFFNQELWGRETSVPWGVYVPTAPDAGTLLRHPSPIYEALLEGVVVGIIIAIISRWRGARQPGVLSAAFLILYSIARFVAEYFRVPDAQIGFLWGGLTWGQYLSLIVLVIGCFLLYTVKNTPHGSISRQ